MNLPPLREELSIREGPRGPDGEPGWILHDPARNRFFRLDWLTCEILQRWSLRQPSLIVQQIQTQTPLRPEVADVEVVLKFLADQHLLHLAGAATSRTLSRQWQERHPSPWRWLIHHYLFFRVPLIRPQRLLEWLERRSQFLFRPTFWGITALAGVLGLGLVARQWDVFAATWSSLFNLHGLLGFLGVMVAVKVIHEFGHGLAATHFGCRVPTMGVAFLVLTPVAYTDVNEAWNLAPRRPRLWIGAAGVLAEAVLAVWATLAWVLLPDGYWRSAAFMVATVTWVKSLVINLSPVMRFDGYYLLSDLLDLPNLHSRAFALARWHLREVLFDLGAPAPETFRPTLARGLILFAWFVWIYRLILFIGIAVFVYHAFFKALGIVLFVVEILWFILLPMFTEFKHWYSRRRDIARRPRTRWTLGAAAALLVLAAWPLPTHLRLAGALLPAQELRILVPAPAQLVRWQVDDGEWITRGATLAELLSPQLEQRVARDQARESALAAELDAAAVDPSQRHRAATLQAALATARAARREAEAALAQLTPVAPFDGVVRWTDVDRRPGEWLSHQEQLATLISREPWQVTGYVAEEHLHLVQPGLRATFVPEGAPEQSFPLVLTTIERDAARVLPHPMLSTEAGGSVPARISDEGMLPETAVYRITFQTEGAPDELGQLMRRGRVVVRAGREAALARWSRAAASVVWREAGF